MALNLEKIVDAIADASDVDLRRIEAARRELARGALEIDPDRIAEKLIEMDTCLRRRDHGA